MTESEWFSCEDPRLMVERLRGRVSERKLRLFACAFWRWHRGPNPEPDPDMIRMLADAEGWAESGTPPDRSSGPLLPIWSRLHPIFARQAADAANWTTRKTARGCWTRDSNQAAEQQVVLLRDIFGPLLYRKAGIHLVWLSRADVAVMLAQAAYEHRILPSGTLDPARLAVLADALEDAGCTDPVLLQHLRGAGPHVRGCFAVDAVLGRS